ncbi:MAG: DUF1549 and DUF1553 domain-containing protein [Gemmatales bacterium]|nr:DUF1549 and DUF1553 domain-containing protein [Gemmatales bacterium]MDW7993669.1 DUF1549 and DUF1553 domain-containing protein [Gemmatales bacterium]
MTARRWHSILCQRLCKNVLMLVVYLVLCGQAFAGDASSPVLEKKLPDAPPPSAPLVRLEILPSEIVLDGPRSRQQLVVLGHYQDGRIWDWTRGAKWSAQGPQVRIENATAYPHQDGETVIRAEVQGVTAEAGVRVQRAQADVPVNFKTEVIPIFNKLGCNQGACHGAQHGRGGFKLSLLGFDPIADYGEIVRSAEGRRVVLSDPDRSILLGKPSLQMEHGGGERLRFGSWEYQVLKAWLEDGAPAPTHQDPEVTRLEILPARRTMKPGEWQQILVRAVWSNGRVEDVTALAQYDSLNDGLARVTPSGLVQCLERGETYIMVRFCGQASVFQVTSPYTDQPVAFDFPPNNYIDELLAKKWRSLGLTPSPLCCDAEFLRRIYLDTIGTLPTPDEIKAFLTDPSPDKRQKAIDRVLNRPEFVDFWALKWGDLLRNNSDVLQAKGMWSLHNWIRASLRDNKPLDQFVRELLTAQGSTYAHGPANFYRLGRSPNEWAEVTSQVFLGIRVQCAQCHHHPFEKWSQDDYWGFAAFFARVATKNSQEYGLFGRETVVYLRPTGEVMHPRRGSFVAPKPFESAPIADDGGDRRQKLADWITSPSNAYFARNFANRFWGYFMGRGLVEPLDDLRATNPPTNPELLDALAQDLITHRFDIKHLMRTIMNSRAYQLSAEVTPGNAVDKDNIYFARRTIRRLTAEQLADAIDYATGTETKYRGLPLGTRAIQLPDSSVPSYLLDVLGRPPRVVTCECERSLAPNLAAALHLLNGDVVNQKIRQAGGRIDRLFQQKKSLSEIVEELYLVTLCRPPTSEELQAALKEMKEVADPRIAAEDLLWSLINSRGFLFNY